MLSMFLVISSFQIAIKRVPEARVGECQCEVRLENSNAAFTIPCRLEALIVNFYM